MSNATTDPDEPLEVYDGEGRPTGLCRSRAEVHANGDWHLAFFCWVVRKASRATAQGDLETVLQRRAAHKDVWPGRFDASAAGHVRFGETIDEAAREIDEKLALRVEPRELQHLFRYKQERAHESGLIDRELHDVHLLRCDRELREYRPGPEVSGLVAVPIAALLELAAGTRDAIATTLVTFDEDGHAHDEPKLLRRDELVPYDPGYLEAVAARARMPRELAPRFTR